MNRKLMQDGLMIGIVSLVYLFSNNLYYIVLFAQLIDNGIKFNTEAKTAFALIIISTFLIICLITLSSFAISFIKKRRSLIEFC